MYWLCLFCVEIANRTWLFYGYAQLAHVDAHWQLEPQALIDELYSHPGLSVDERQDCLAEILKWIAAETGIEFIGRDAGRLGNFEVVRYVVGNYDQPDGLCHHPEPPRAAGGGASVTVWIEPPLAEQSPLLLECRMYNGHPRDLRTLIADEIRHWPSAGANAIRFTAPEPISSYELSVWTESGRLLARQDQWLLRRVRGEIAIADLGVAVSTPWDARLPEPHRRHVLEATGVTRQPFHAAGPDADPWVAAEDRKRTILNELGPATGAGRFFPAGQDHHVETILFLARLMTRSGVRRVILADPYLDRSAVESLLVRIRDVPELVVLTSHESPQAARQETLVENICDGLMRFTQFICRLLRAERQAEKDDPVQMLTGACNRYRATLPRRMRIVNLHSSDSGRGQQFHDRMLLVDLGDAGRELWSLTNSISMLARRFPLLVARMDADVTRSAADYLGQLESAALPGRNDLRSTVIWENPATPATSAVGAATPPAQAHRWADDVLSLLLTDIPPRQRLQAALRAGFLEPDVHPGTTTWRLVAATRARVLDRIAEYIHSQQADVHVVRAVATWAYHGGPQALEYALDNRAVGFCERALRQALQGVPVSSHGGTALDLSSDQPAPDALDGVRIYVNQRGPGDLHPGHVPELHFLCELLWRLAPERLVAIEDETRSSWVAGWLAANAQGLSAAQIQAILRAGVGRLRALGVVILWDRDLDHNAAPVARLNALVDALSHAGLPPMDVLLLSLASDLPGAGAVDTLRERVNAIIARHHEAFGEGNRQRLVDLLSTPGRLHHIVRVNAVAAACSAAEDQRWFSEWCIAEIIRHLPRRNHPSTPRSNADPSPSDVDVRIAYAQCLWRIHGVDAPARYIQEVVDTLTG